MKLTAQYDRQIAKLSLSVRRAWIEIFFILTPSHQAGGSLSVRRAWIEIPSLGTCQSYWQVALREESVD